MIGICAKFIATPGLFKGAGEVPRGPTLKIEFLLKFKFSGESIENCAHTVITGTSPTLTCHNFG